MFGPDVLTFQEFMMSEPLPLATVHKGVLEFLRGRDDVVVFDDQAVNAYVSEPRVTEVLDLLSTRAESLAEELRDHLHQQFHVALRVRRVGEGQGFRVFQVRKSGNRHLVDLRHVEALPAAQRMAGVLVIAPAELIARKVIAYHRRRGQPKSGTDWRDLAMLLLRFPELKRDPGPVTGRLQTADTLPEALAVWRELVAQEIKPAIEDEEFNFYRFH